MAYGAILGQKPPLPSIDETFEVGDTLTTLRKDLGENWVLADGGLAPTEAEAFLPPLQMNTGYINIKNDINPNLSGFLNQKYIGNGNWIYLFKDSSGAILNIYKITNNDAATFKLVKGFNIREQFSGLTDWRIVSAFIGETEIVITCRWQIGKIALIKISLDGDFISKHENIQGQFNQLKGTFRNMGIYYSLGGMNYIISQVSGTGSVAYTLFKSKNIGGPYTALTTEQNTYSEGMSNFFITGIGDKLIYVCGHNSGDLHSVPYYAVINASTGNIISKQNEIYSDDRARYISVIPEDNCAYSAFYGGSGNCKLLTLNLSTNKFSLSSWATDKISVETKFFKMLGRYYGIEGSTLYRYDSLTEDGIRGRVAVKTGLDSFLPQEVKYTVSVEVNYDNQELQKFAVGYNWHQQKLPTITNPENVNTFIKIK